MDVAPCTDLHQNRALIVRHLSPLRASHPAGHREADLVEDHLCLADGDDLGTNLGLVGLELALLRAQLDFCRPNRNMGSTGMSITKTDEARRAAGILAREDTKGLANYHPCATGVAVPREQSRSWMC